MKALAYLLRVPFFNLAGDPGIEPVTRGDPELPAFASTPEAAGAWRRWAEEGRLAAASGSGGVTRSRRDVPVVPSAAWRPGRARSRSVVTSS